MYTSSATKVVLRRLLWLSNSFQRMRCAGLTLTAHKTLNGHHRTKKNERPPSH